jgi:hypothetical protein
MKGQITFVNLIGVFITLIVYYSLLPILNGFSETTIATLEASPGPYTTLVVSLIYLAPFTILMSIIMTAINYANPNREGLYR